ncbi:hypothetical protein SAMN05518683_108103 [Salibacterium halotolerans]|uniref:Uncharacterized protein n=1 Tax=Salibacterium halotolerans TaxID=1884432 RepID=A0A1I5S9R6_9BACI|nr:hypothetical protein SAMN05518683_108103 [Salibacterium halotolerans]
MVRKILIALAIIAGIYILFTILGIISFITA